MKVPSNGTWWTRQTSKTDFVDASALARDFAASLKERPDCTPESGLTTEELQRAEDFFRVSMPPLWREVLGIVHPVELPEPARDADGVRRWTRFPDWRLRDIPATQALIDVPVEGLLFDVQSNGFWWRAWGEPPLDTEERTDRARQELSQVPKLTPLWNHLYVESSDASPVFSIVQADLYVPFLSLESMISGDTTSEDGVPTESYPIGHVPFWSLLHAWSQVGHMSESFGGLATGGL